MDLLTNTVKWMQAKVDQVFGFFGIYTASYSKLIVYGVLLLALSKVLKSKVNLNVGK